LLLLQLTVASNNWRSPLATNKRSQLVDLTGEQFWGWAVLGPSWELRAASSKLRHVSLPLVVAAAAVQVLLRCPPTWLRLAVTFVLLARLFQQTGDNKLI